MVTTGSTRATRLAIAVAAIAATVIATRAVTQWRAERPRSPVTAAGGSEEHRFGATKATIRPARRPSPIELVQRELVACTVRQVEIDATSTAAERDARLESARPDLELRAEALQTVTALGVDADRMDAQCGGGVCRLTVRREGTLAFRDSVWEKMRGVDGDRFVLLDSAISELAPAAMSTSYWIQRRTVSNEVLLLLERVSERLRDHPGCLHGDAVVTVEMRAGQLTHSVVGTPCIADVLLESLAEIRNTARDDQTVTRRFTW